MRVFFETNDDFLLQSKNESYLSEMNIVIADVMNTIYNFKQWVAPENVRELINDVVGSITFTN